MGRRPNLIPSVMLNVALPLDIHTRMTAFLYSELEGRVPHGAYQSFLVERIREFFGDEALDLAPWFAEAPVGAWVVRGTPQAIKNLYGKLSHE